MENSIEEDIKIALDKFLDNKDINSAIFIVEKFILGNYILRCGRKNIVKDSLRYILSDYKRALKENEEWDRKFCDLQNLYFKLQDEYNIALKENEELKENIKEENELNKIIKDTKLDELFDRRNGEKVIPVQEVKDKIEELDKTIKFQKDINKKELDRHKKTEKSLKGQIIKQNKIIDLMTEFIEDELTVDEFCTRKGCYADDYIDGHCKKCLNCIKKYFENKTKEER